MVGFIFLLPLVFCDQEQTYYCAEIKTCADILHAGIRNYVGMCCDMVSVPLNGHAGEVFSGGTMMLIHRNWQHATTSAQ